MNNLPPPTTLNAWITLDRHGQPDTMTITDEGRTVAHTEIHYGPHAVEVWDATINELGYRRVSPWRGDDSGLWAAVARELNGHNLDHPLFGGDQK